MDFNFVDSDDFNDIEERRILERRLNLYSPAALLAAQSIERIYVVFPAFKDALAHCDRIFQISRVLETPQGALILGEPGTSKTTLAQYFISSLPQTDLFQVGFGAILIRLRASPSPGLIVSQLLRELKYPFTEVRKNKVYAMRDIVFDAIKQKGTKLVFVDQAHALAYQLRPRTSVVQETGASDILRELMDETKVGLVLLADASFGGLEEVDRALADRVPVRLKLGHFSDGAVWNAFLRAFARCSNDIDLEVFTREDIAANTLIATSGSRRTFRRLVVEGALVAVDSGSTRLDVQHLRVAYDRIRGGDCPVANPYGK